MLDLKIQTYQKLIARKVLCFSHSKVSKLDSINSRTVSINSQTASNVSKLNSRPRSSKFARMEDRESSFEYRASRDCQLTFERYCMFFDKGQFFLPASCHIFVFEEMPRVLGTECYILCILRIGWPFQNFLQRLSQSECWCPSFHVKMRFCSQAN